MVPARSLRLPLLLVATFFAGVMSSGGCNTKTLANEKHCRALSADACRADSTCVAVGGPGLEPHPESIASGKRCEPACASGGLPRACDWTPRGSMVVDSARTARDGRVCAGPARCEVKRWGNGFEACDDPKPPCAGCRQVFQHCQSANLCSGVICP